MPAPTTRPAWSSSTRPAATRDIEHQMAHAWFGKDNINELWLREGLADWVAAAVTGTGMRARHR